MQKIIHMSDLHVGYEDLEAHFNAIVTTLIGLKGDKPKDYVIVITGDTVNNAYEPKCYDKVINELDRLRQAGFEDILVVPGNHDYGTGSKGDPKFVDFFKEAYFDQLKEYPVVEIKGEIAFLGLDSMAEELHWYDKIFAEGQLGKDQLDRLHHRLRESSVRNCAKRVVYLHHHPFDPHPFHELLDASDLGKVLTAALSEGISIDALLFGHNHAGTVRNGLWGIRRCYDAGSATLKERKGLLKIIPGFEVRARTRVIDIGSEDVRNDYILGLP